MLRLGIDEEKYDWIVGALHESGIARENLEAVMGGMLRVVLALKSGGDGHELVEYFAGLGLDQDQTKLVLGLAARIAGAGQEDKGEGDK